MSFIENEPDVRQPRWLEWVERNAQPRTFHFSRPRQIPTRWQKRGPMTRKDWVRFYHWASKKAIPRPLYEPKPEKEPPCNRKKGPCRKNLKPKPLDEIMAYVDTLTAPKFIREKYEFPSEPDHPYSPKIHRKQPAKKDKGRPFQPVIVPPCFQHWEVEAEFWNTVRFPVRPGAMKYKISANINRLANPREWPFPLERLHCQPPEVIIEEVPKRKKMSYKQWRSHLKRLEYLARPVVRPEFDALYDACL